MPSKKELGEDMPIWQDHEQRITTLEVTMTGLSNKMDKVDGRVEKVDDTIKEGNKEQKELLDTINNRMVEEFFVKKRKHFDNWWKFVFLLIGGSSVLYLIIDKLSLLF